MLTTNTLALIVAAIWQTEGASYTSHPYGIVSVKVHSAEQARVVCECTVKNNWRRYEELTHQHAVGISSVCPDSMGIGSNTNGVNFINYMADRYCPPSIDPVGNINWKRNMILLLKQKGLIR